MLYCPQTRVSAKGTPSELYFAAQQLAAQRGRSRGDLPSLIQQLGLEQGVLNQPWSELSVRRASAEHPAVCLLAPSSPRCSCVLQATSKPRSKLCDQTGRA